MPPDRKYKQIDRNMNQPIPDKTSKHNSKKRAELFEMVLPSPSTKLTLNAATILLVTKALR